MKKYFILSSIIIFSLLIQKQSFAKIVYTDLVPDSMVILNSSISQWQGIPLDFDKDGVEDCYFKWSNSGVNSWSIKIVPGFNPGTRTNEVMVNASGSLVEAKNLGDLINGNQNYGFLFTEPILAESLNANFAGQGDKYIGLRFKSSGNAHFAWVLVSILDTLNTVTLNVKSYGYDDVIATSLKAGDTGVGTATNRISEYQQINVYPNPTSNFINVDLDSNELPLQFIKIYDINAREVYIENNVPIEKQINIEFLKPGLYFFSLKTKQRRVYIKSFLKL